MSKKSFYCWYLGFTETHGLEGQSRVYDLIKNLISFQNKENGAVAPSKVTLHLNENCMTLIDSSFATPNKKNNRKVANPAQKQLKSYSINYQNVTFVGRLADPLYSDILTCIVKNDVMTAKNSIFYLHAFRCDSGESTKKMEQYLNYFRKSYFKKLEKSQSSKQKENNLVRHMSKKPLANEPLSSSYLKENFIKRQMLKISDHFQNHSNSSAGTQSSSSQNEFSLNSTAPNMNIIQYPFKKNVDHSNEVLSRSTSPKAFNDIHREITEKLEAGVPFLYPAKDYSEMDRKRGNLKERDNRKCLNEKIVGEQAVKLKNYLAVDDDTNETDEVELYLNLSSNSKSENLDTQRSVDFNSLSFNEQATQVLNYLDEIVDSVDTIYKPVSPIDSNRNIYKYEPPENIFATDNSAIEFKPEDSNDSYYEPYEPLTDITYQPHVKSGLQRPADLKKNPLHAIDEETSLPRDLNAYFGQKPGDLYQRQSQEAKKIKASPVKRVFSIRSNNKPESTETTNSSVSAANIGEFVFGI